MAKHLPVCLAAYLEWDVDVGMASDLNHAASQRA